MGTGQKKAGELFREALELTMCVSELEERMDDSGVIAEEELWMYLRYRNCENPFSVEEYKLFTERVEKLFLAVQIYPEVYFEAAYQYAYALWEKGEYVQCRDICNKAITWLKRGIKSFHLAEFHFLSAVAGMKLMPNKENERELFQQCKMAYYRLSQVIKMRREALGHNRHEYDVEGPSGMTVYRMEKGEGRASEKTYRKLTRAMGEEESTRRGVLEAKDVRVLWLLNTISDSFFNKNYERTEILINKLEEWLDCSVKRNQQYLGFVKAKLQYKKGLLDIDEYEKNMKKEFSYATMDFEKLMERKWPFSEREWNRLQELIEVIRKEKDYEQQKNLLNQMKVIIETKYMEREYKIAYLIYVRYRLGDVLGNLMRYREAIEIDEETLKLCGDCLEWRYLPEVYYDIFWNYWMIKKKETLTEQEETRCKECLLKAYYLNKAWCPFKKLYEMRLKECYPEELE